AIKHTLAITQKRRIVQEEFNKKHGITPQTVKKAKIETLEETFGLKEDIETDVKKIDLKKTHTTKDLEAKIKEIQKEMKKAAKELRFEDAARLRDLMHYYQNLEIVK
ncbi:MAG: hypothetical protein K940chlam4_01500, partial [Candidatus Anoxychlamydiales bacterium]|nr:hypothetical protein [Candidatus Anoxychlamydiales bacterium]